MKTYSVISFATHGLIAGEIGSHDADLVLTPPAQSGDEDDGLLSTGEIAELSLDADLVILSACNTAAGDSENEEGHSGLADAFFYAGARSLLVSHWPVYSDAATDLTTHAIDQATASDDMTIAHGLRLAMLAALDAAGDDPRKQHPAYWAPFTLVGDGAVRF
jgi:CHAT domain-containing protein